MMKIDVAVAKSVHFATVLARSRLTFSLTPKTTLRNTGSFKPETIGPGPKAWILRMPVFVFSFRRSKAKVVSSSCRMEDQPRRLQRHIATPLGEPGIDKTSRKKLSRGLKLSPNMVVSWSKYTASTVPKRWVNTGLKIFKTINHYMVIVPSIFTLLELSVMGLVCVR